MAQIIFHIDINAFFASAHTIQEPALEGKPVAVCSNHRGSVITTASYPARVFGVQSAMPLAHAKRLCPDLIVVDMDFELYQDLSKKFFDIIRSYSTKLQQASIDECYVDVTEVIKTYDKPLDLASEIQQRVLKELKLPISIGVAPNKFLAKMASDMLKPMGITVLRIREVDKHLWPLPIHEMHGIGKKTVPRLIEAGITTIGDLAQQDPEKMRQFLGINAQSFVQKANGIDYSIIETESTAKSIGQSKTFTNAMTELDEIRHAIMVEVSEVERRVKRADMAGKTITFALRMENFKTAARSVTLDSYVDDKNLIFERVMSLYDEFDGQDGISFISVSLSNLVYKDEIVEQLNIFDDLENPTINDIISRLNDELKTNVFKTPRDLLKEQ
ncbi:DNA polymerase IV [Erysipelothrix sp. HDW6C]|uniref:DNA polymerase IV n=1 Tax=Erysipelothrix sp. HDW6C TaxID=2714930 RepID=UPI00140A60F7|nr:DNA polymerase IV [Erysipelothrix sp. HDW6C]QIK70053.1 DNA polymerase IV [Erysipelothrix sp. HDW6C]